MHGDGRRFGRLAVRPRAASMATGLIPSASASRLARPCHIGAGTWRMWEACAFADRRRPRQRARTHSRLRKRARTHTCAHNTHARTHARTYAHRHTHTHTHVNMLTHMRTRISHTRARARTLACAHAHLRGHRCTHTTYERARAHRSHATDAQLRKHACSTRALLCFALLCFALRCVGLRGGCAALPTVAQATSPPAPEASDSCAGSPPRPAFAAQLTLDQGLVFRSGAPAFCWVGSSS